MGILVITFIFYLFTFYVYTKPPGAQTICFIGKFPCQSTMKAERLSTSNNIKRCPKGNKQADLFKALSRSASANHRSLSGISFARNSPRRSTLWKQQRFLLF